MTFSDTLARLMEENKISSYRLAKDIGVRVSTVTNWKKGINPNMNHLVAIANRFDVSVDSLVKATA